MKIYFIILIVLSGVLGTLSKDNCAWGPTYWCQDIKSAKECNAIKHCSQTVWSSAKTKDTNDICQTCENVITKIRQIVSDKTTQDQILHALEEGCALIPVPDIANQCKNTVDQYLPEIFEMLTSELDPNVICTALHLCNQNIRTIEPKLKDPSTYCEDCKKFLNDVKEIATKSKSDLIAIFNQICDQLPPESAGLCHQLVATYIDVICYYILNQIDPNVICPAIGFCPASIKTMSFESVLQRLVQTNSLEELSTIRKTKADPATYCDDCLKFSADIKEALTSNMTAEQFLQLLDNICDTLGSQISSECRMIAQNYYMVIYNYIVDQLDPKSVCYIIRFCKSSSIIPKQEVKSSIKMNSTFECFFCQFVVKSLDNMLKENRTQEAIRQALDKVCTLFPQSFVQQCEDFVNQYAEGLIVLLASELDPQYVCSELDLCPPQMKQIKKSSPIVCDVCSMIIQYLDKQLLDNATEQEISYMVDKVCYILPTQVKAQCLSIVETYGPYLIQMVASVINPELICQDLGLCSRTVGHVELLGRDKCLYGPSYWCKSIAHAKACKAEEHCRRHGWKN